MKAVCFIYGHFKKNMDFELLITFLKILNVDAALLYDTYL
jgi:hypothetical protein